MAAPPVCDFNWPAPDFSLPATDGSEYSLGEIAGENGTVVMFICNHCPYVLAVLDRLKRDASELLPFGIGMAAICSNDAISHPDDSFEKMIEMADRQNFPFPYLHDEDQTVARAYGAACTPDFFGFNASLKLQYRGRLDDAGRKSVHGETRRDLLEAMKLISKTGSGPKTQYSSMGCSIKWKNM
ncbi:MAG: thioredoxin family protein [Roseovarius sp.]|nr:thioredoxin family protein [Roseovarius sp.]